jgi:hypothetical protein
MAKVEKIKDQELQDLLQNIGILQEVNRTFFNPIGLNLVLNKNLNLELEKTEDEEGIISHTVDKFRLQIFNEFRNKKHRARHEKLGCIIQTKDLIRNEKLAEKEDLKLSTPENLKLKKLLSCVDEAAYAMKKNLMEHSANKDRDAQEIPFNEVFRAITFDMEQGKFLDAATKMILIHFQEDIELELDRIEKIKTDQRRILKGDKKK